MFCFNELLLDGVTVQASLIFFFDFLKFLISCSEVSGGCAKFTAMGKLENVNPNIYEKLKERAITALEENEDENDLFDEREVFDLIRSINDPEHPLTLEELKVVDESNVHVDNDNGVVSVLYTPTIPHCSMATLIGLSIRVQLLRTLPPRFKVKVEITPGTHANELDVNKQLADKERVAAALENSHLLEVVNQCLKTKMLLH